MSSHWSLLLKICSPAPMGAHITVHTHVPRPGAELLLTAGTVTGLISVTSEAVSLWEPHRGYRQKPLCVCVCVCVCARARSRSCSCSKAHCQSLMPCRAAVNRVSIWRLYNSAPWNQFPGARFTCLPLDSIWASPGVTDEKHASILCTKE